MKANARAIGQREADRVGSDASIFTTVTCTREPVLGGEGSGLESNASLVLTPYQSGSIEQFLGHAAAVLRDLAHDLFVQPQIHCGRIVHVATECELFGERPAIF